MRAIVTAIRRYAPVIAALAITGLAGGITATAVNPPNYASADSVLTSPQLNAGVPQEYIVTSVPVLQGALRSLGLRLPLTTLRQRVTATAVSNRVLSITAQGTSPTQAQRTVLAVTKSYMRFIGAHADPQQRHALEILDAPALLRHTSALVIGAVTGALGLLAGLVLGILLALLISAFPGGGKRPLTYAGAP